MSNAIIKHVLENRDLGMLKFYGKTSAWWLSAEFVRDAREKAGLSQQELANRLGVSLEHVKRMEHPTWHATVATLVRVATACGGELSLDLKLDN